jgi:putative hydrolase of the HAD superfamily
LEKTTCADSSGRFPTAESAERDRWFAIVAEVLAEIPDTRRAFEELWAHFESPKAWRVFNDVHPLLQCADRHGIPIAIGSNFDQRLRGVLAGHDATAALENLVISSEVGWRKPDPDFYRRAEIAIGFPARHVAWIGDSLTHDYHAPRDAGFQAILLDRGRTQHFTHAISSLTAIVDWIESNRNSA